MQNKTEVIIVGAGPTGVVLATLLGQKNIPVILLEKETAVFPVTRATHLDPETLRNFQMTGLVEELKKYTESITHFDVVDKNGKKVFEQVFADQETNHYYNDDYFFDQVPFEHILRKGLERYSSVKLIVDTEVVEIKETNKEVQIVANQKSGGKINLSANWVVGCDGGTSFVRESLFPKMKQIKAPKDWILVDTVLNKPEYASLLPDRFRYYLSDERLSANAHGFGLNRRWEFETIKGEPMPQEDEIKSWVEKYIALDKITFLRIKQYTHRSLITPTWRKNRVFLAGDAAHLMPPFAGQGMCSGVRDAVNLAWKLAAVIQKKANASLLDSYDTERQFQIKHTYKQTHLLNEILVAETPLQKMRRKLQLQSIELMPQKVKSFIQKSFANSKPFVEGCIHPSAKLRGGHLPQFLLSEHALSDDKIGYEWALIYAPSAFEKAGIKIDLYPIRLETNKIWEDWLKIHKIDFAIVRPDKIIFSGDKVKKWEIAYQAYKNWGL